MPVGPTRMENVFAVLGADSVAALRLWRAPAEELEAGGGRKRQSVSEPSPSPPALKPSPDRHGAIADKFGARA